jgi:hypothetical protein
MEASQSQPLSPHSQHSASEASVAKLDLFAWAPPTIKHFSSFDFPDAFSTFEITLRSF